MHDEPLYRTDPYARSAEGRITALTPEGGIIVTPHLFYPQGGGQPGDSGWLVAEGQRIEIVTTLRSPEGQIVLVPASSDALPAPGTPVAMQLDWACRHAHMRIHTALHLLSVVIPLPVNGGQIRAGTGRLDFDTSASPDIDFAAAEARLNALIEEDLPVTTRWITAAELDANPQLIKTMSVRPPIGQGQVRLVRIGTPDHQVDLQPCGGTHVARTAEIGAIRFARIENKGRQNRRVNLVLEP